MVLGALPSPAPVAEAPPPPLATTFGQQQGAPPRSGHSGAPIQDYAHLVRTLQQRSISRSSSSTAAVIVGDVAPPPATATTASQIEQDLKLAAQIGQTLLNEKAALQAKLEQSERANQKLLERLGTAVKENNKLEKRLDESLGNLDQADSSNRALLVSLEEDRKTISRLSHDSGKLVAASATLKQLQIAHADVLEDLAAERRRADLAEARARKAADRAEELDERLRKACSDLEEMRQDKVLSAKRSSDALALLKAKQAAAAGNATSDGGGGGGTGGDGHNGPSDQTQTRELMRIVETLVEENHLLRSESMELHGLLEREREDQELAREENGFLSALGIREHAGSDDNGGEEQDQADNVPRRRSGGGFMLRRLSASSSLSHTSPQPDHSQEPRAERLMASRTRSTAASNGGKMPVQRPRNRRTQSMDVTSQLRSFVGTSSAPNSPYQGGVPFGRPASILSNASEDPDTSLSSSIRPRRRHRPLSLSLNSSVFSPSMGSSSAPNPNPEAEESVLVSPFTRPSAHRRQSSQTSFNFGLASPRTEQPGRRISRSPRPSPSRRPSSTAGVDASTQTSRPSSPSSPRSRRSETPHRHAAPDYSLPQTPIAAATDGHRHASHDSIASPASSSAVHTAAGGGATVRAGAETRTAALAQLIEYGVKLLARVQAADIATQEKRLRKQNLPGDVKHLAQANIKELAGDIDSLRDRFRRVVELERAAQHRDHTPTVRHDLSGRNDISLVTRRDFVSLVKLLRDLLSETSRLRQLVNRVQLEPALAQRLSELDVPGAVDAGTASEPKATRPAAAEAAATLLAPLSRLLGVASPEQASSSTADNARPNLAQSRRGGSSTVSTATINVEFGGGGVRPAPSSTLSPDSVASRRGPPTGAGAHPRQVRRELSSIFAGATTSTRRAQSPGPGVQSREIPAPAAATTSTSRFVSAAASAATSYMPFSRILSSYRPAMSSTANAVIDSIPSAPPVLDSPFDEDDENGGAYSPPSTLLERQLRPRGLSDSSVRSTFVTHAGHTRPNPHHRIVTAAGLALSSEATPVPIVVAPAGVSVDEASYNAAIALSSSPASLGAAMSALRQKLEEDDADTAAALAEGKTISRRASRAHLRGRASSSRLRESSTIASSSSPPPPVPPLPPPLSNELKLSTSTATSDSSLSLNNHVVANASPNPTVSVQAPNTPPAPTAPISISPSSTRPGIAAPKPPKDSTASSSSLFGTVVSSAFGSLIGGGGGGGAGDLKRASVLGAPHGAESFRERGRLG